MFALYELFILPMTITCRPSRSFFLFSFCFIFYVRKNYTSIVIYEKSFFFVHLHSYTQQTFSVHKTLYLYINMVYKNPILVQRFLFSFFNIHSWFYTKNFFIYPHCSHTRISFHTLFIHTQKKNSFLFFIYRYDSCSQPLFLFLFLVLS